MYFLLFLAVVVCVLLGAIVLIQNPKGGGLSSNFSSSSQLLGVQKTGDILEKGTWILAVALMVLSLAINVIGKGGSAKTDISNQQQIEKSLTPSNNTATPGKAAPLPVVPNPKKP
ncbi:preprotein translocase subunit SecG [Mucilaginibacter sp. PPCGB 2223]|uniref:preprotein translocase subunit SecG n=1 Tax=Mucilaginibacter sp. PPCGB 2223 TaxID=1886027 RepID=UPI0008265DF2|nr:preprotein translocase subunit SecG [Mucilaginibacter sp. PPCGB 2223]OCX50771.1 preprotein translocase subunit SecG [Mucilaginibacter sp. PPCGB 2223]